MKKIIFTMLAGMLILAGCGSNTKSGIVGPEAAVDAGSQAIEAAQGAVVASDSGSGTGALMAGSVSFSGAPSSTSGQAPAYILPPSLYAGTPDAEGYYTIDTGNRNYFPIGWMWWATQSLTMKSKVVNASGADMIAAFKAMGGSNYIANWITIVVANGSVTVTTIIDGAGTYRTAHIEFNKKVTYDSVNVRLVVQDAGDMDLKNTVSVPSAGWTGIYEITNTDLYVIPFWVHGETVTYTGSFGHSATFNLIRNNTWGNANYGFHTGDGSVAYQGAEIAKVHFNGDGTGYYTLTKENHATQHAFNERAAR